MLIYNIYPRQFGKTEYLLQTLIMYPDSILITFNNQSANTLKKRCNNTSETKRIFSANTFNMVGISPSKILLDEYAFYDNGAKDNMMQMYLATSNYNQENNVDVIICTTLNKNYSTAALEAVRSENEPTDEFFNQYPTIVKEEYLELKNDLLGYAHVINIMTDKLKLNKNQASLIREFKSGMVKPTELGNAFYHIEPFASEN